MITLEDMRRQWDNFQCSALMMEYSTAKFDPEVLRKLQEKLNEHINLYIEESIMVENDKNEDKSQH